jgi:hypothetical protein
MILPCLLEDTTMMRRAIGLLVILALSLLIAPHTSPAQWDTIPIITVSAPAQDPRLQLASEAAVVAHIRAVTEADPAVKWIMLPLTMHLGPHDVLLNLEIKFREELSAAEIGAAVDRIEQHLRRRDPDIKRIFIEAESLSPAGRQESPRRLE